jgi:signal transduction histidine kinase
LELTGAVAPEVPTRLRGDPGRLRRILTNLVGNAIKFTHAGKVVIRVTAEQSPAALPPNGWLGRCA